MLENILLSKFCLNEQKNARCTKFFTLHVNGALKLLHVKAIPVTNHSNQSLPQFKQVNLPIAIVINVSEYTAVAITQSDTRLRKF